MISNNLQQEKEMHVAYLKQTGILLAEAGRFIKDGTCLPMGFESEVAILPEDSALNNTAALRDSIIAEVGDSTDVELGASQIELRTPPIDVFSRGGFNELANIYRTRFRRLNDSATRHNASIVRSGTNPFLPIKNTPRTQKPKYQLVPDYYNLHRPKETDTTIGLGRQRIDIGDAAVVSLFQSFQINLEAQSLTDACDKMNRSLMIAPYLLAFCGNARYLECIDTKMNDLRMMGWGKSHDTGMQDVRLLAWERSFDLRSPEEISSGKGLRIGLPERYFQNIAEYLDRAGTFPFILFQPDAALSIAIGMTWLDARIKFIGDSAVVELRLLPTQPTIEEELLLTLCYLGRLADSQVRNEPLLPLTYVKINRLSAMYYGARSKYWFLSDNGKPERLSYTSGMKRELRRIQSGLVRLGLSSAFNLDLFHDFLQSGSPSDRLGRSMRKYKSLALSQRMKNALRETGMIV